MFARVAVLSYGVIAYFVFFFTFLYAIGFVGNWVVPKTIDSGEAGPLATSLIINALLLSVFVVQHTVMARPRFKKWITQFIPVAIERSTFVLLASASLILVFAFWHPAPGVIYDASATWAKWPLILLSLAGWATVLLSSFVISHFDLFGLRQVYLHWRQTDYHHLPFNIRGIYKLVRHPLMVGFLIAFWATPKMTVGHLFFAVMTTIYIFIGVWFEERDLVTYFGEKYLGYRAAVRGFVPIPKKGPRSGG